MRYIRYPQRGRPSDTRSNNFDELLLITLAALTIANTERRLAEYFLRKNKSIPNHIESKKEAYEVSVVENFYKLGQQNFALHGSIPIWERRINIPASQNTKSENFSIDISLFNPVRREESRIEFGFYNKNKLKNDTDKLIKLHNLKDSGFENINNFIILWTEDKRPPKQNKYTDEENKNKSLRNSTNLWFNKFKKDVKEINKYLQNNNKGNNKFKLNIISSSTMDIFSENKNVEGKRIITAALFDISLN